ncbi:MAG: hypothetical protein CM15mP129_02480 [Chloroflexota bacterium]|nr:MAG: hypothetical protein CM15mP129_02480 [Chloroflexota bacterium]
MNIANKQERKLNKMNKPQVQDLIQAGVHFGHLTRKWNPNMSPYIYMEKMGFTSLIYTKPRQN